MTTNQTTSTKKTQPARMWTPPKGWFQAAIAGRLDREREAARIEDNNRRRQYGLPTCEV